MYYIVSLKHTRKHDYYMTLWGANNHGYCFSKPNAGTYIEIDKNYHNPEWCMPVLVEILDKYFLPLPFDGQTLMMIPNCKAVLDILNLKMTSNGLVRKQPVQTS